MANYPALNFVEAVAIDTNLLVALRAIDLLLTPIPSHDHMFYCSVSIWESYQSWMLAIALSS